MKKIRVKIISFHQPNEIVEMGEVKAKELAKLGHVEILDGKQTSTKYKNDRSVPVTDSDENAGTAKVLSSKQDNSRARI